MIRKSRTAAGVALAALAGLTLAACAPAEPAAEPGEVVVPSLTVGTAAPLTNFSDIYVAEANGYFEQAGVDVTIESGVGANGLNSVVSGQLDLLMFGTGQALIPASRGIETTIVYNQIGAGEGAAVAVAIDSPYKTPEDLAGKRVAVLAVGGSSYGWGQYFSSYTEEQGGAPYDIIQSASVSDQVNGILSGHFDAMVSTAALLTSQVADGQVRLLVDPGEPDAAQYIPDQYVETCTFGIADNLDEKREAVVRFVAAMQAADKWMRDASPEDIAAALKSSPAFDGQSLETVAAGAEYDKPFFAPSLGVISDDLWASTLDQLEYWGLPDVDLKDDLFSYENRVDMSYLDAAATIEIDING
jgi:NitT/TauT family transport system substrate-binding protein